MIPILPRTSAESPAPSDNELVSGKQKKQRYNIRKIEAPDPSEYTINKTG